MKLNQDEDDVIIRLIRNEPQKPDATQEDHSQCPSNAPQKVMSGRRVFLILVRCLTENPEMSGTPQMFCANLFFDKKLNARVHQNYYMHL